MRRTVSVSLSLCFVGVAIIAVAAVMDADAEDRSDVAAHPTPVQPSRFSAEQAKPLVPATVQLAADVEQTSYKDALNRNKKRPLITNVDEPANPKAAGTISDEHTNGSDSSLQNRLLRASRMATTPSHQVPSQPISAVRVAQRPARPDNLQSVLTNGPATVGTPTETSVPTAASPAPTSSRRRFQPPPTATPSNEPTRTAVTVEPRSVPRVAADTALMTSHGAAITVRTLGPKGIRLGKPAQYKVIVSNTGTASAAGVMVNVAIPQWAEVTSNRAETGTARFSKRADGLGTLQWNVGVLTGDDKFELSLEITPKEPRPFELAVGWSFLPERSITRVEVLEPKLEMTLTGPKDVLFGETKIYTITLLNPGTGDADNVEVTLLPINPGSDTVGQSNIGTLKAGDRKVFEVELTAREAGKLAIRARASAEGGLRTSVEESIVVRRATLEVAVSGPPLKYAGTVGSYVVRVTNSGDAEAEGVVAEAMLPAGAKFITGTAGADIDEKTGRISWKIGTMKALAVRMFDLKCHLATAGENQLEISTRGKGDLAAAKLFVTKVEALADLKLIIDDPQGPVAVGEDMVYDVHVLNRGTKQAANVSVAAFFSAGVEPLQIEGGKGSLQPGQVVFDNIPSVGPGEDIVFKIHAKAERAGNHIFRVELKCEETETRLTVEESTRFYGETARQDETAIQR